jgi:hypothetical protein
MFESEALAYDQYQLDSEDTEVTDVEEPPLVSISISRPRTATQDLTVHVYVENDGWHRLHATELETSCSTAEDPVPVNFRTDTVKNRRAIEHPLSRRKHCDCWTRRERKEADDRYRERFGLEFRP